MRSDKRRALSAVAGAGAQVMPRLVKLLIFYSLVVKLPLLFRLTEVPRCQS